MLNAITHLSRDLGVAAGGIARFAARHDDRHQCGAGTQGREDRPDHQRGLSRHAGNRLADAPSICIGSCCSRTRRCSWHLARSARRCASSVSAQGEVVIPLDEASVQRAAAELVAATACRRSRSATCSRFSIRRMSSAPANMIAAAHPGIAGLVVIRRRSGVPRIRTHRRHRVRCVYEAGRRPLSGAAGATDCGRAA